jgi:hypothetical protein
MANKQDQSRLKQVADAIGNIGKVFSQKYDESGTGNPLYDALDGLAGAVDSTGRFKEKVQPVLDVIKEAVVYKDGVSETRFGARMEESWVGKGNSFMSGLVDRTVRLTGYNIRFAESTPLDPSADSNTSLYGNLMLGTPMIYTKTTDPANRVMINTFVKDSSFLSLTPGMPKFNGSSFFQGVSKATSEVVKIGAEVLSKPINWKEVGQRTATTALKVGNFITNLFVDGVTIGREVLTISGGAIFGFGARAINNTLGTNLGSNISNSTIIARDRIFNQGEAIKETIKNTLIRLDSSTAITQESSVPVDIVAGAQTNPIVRKSLDEKTIAAYNQMARDRIQSISITEEERRQAVQASQNLENPNPNVPASVISYLLRNGIDSSFAEKDKRYYTFEAKYAEYYAYLETMLNTVWLKLGLGTEDGAQRNFNISTFFDIGSDKTNYQKLSEKYNSSLGFYVNIASRVSESVTNQTFSSGLEDYAGRSADIFQRLNYLTGMGTGGGAQNLRRGVVAGMELFSIAGDTLGTPISLKGIPQMIGSVAKFVQSTDIGALTQAFSTNGKRTIYPELWSNAGYSKNIQFDFNFVSPYGDPLSIFQYVYVPFLSLLTFILPRQVEENGFVSPFFVRADVPGLVTSDLAMITDISWTKGGENNLWTKDKLPRAISGSFTVTDLYPYLAMVKRLSYMSANPSYTVFLDNMAGLRAIYAITDQDAPLSSYWRQMINRVSGAGNTSVDNKLWNRFDATNMAANANFSNTKRDSIARNINRKSVKWMSKI